MSAALRIQLMLLARKNHVGKKSDFADPASPRDQHRVHSAGAVHFEPTSDLGPGDIASSEQELDGTQISDSVLSPDKISR